MNAYAVALPALVIVLAGSVALTSSPATGVAWGPGLSEGSTGTSSACQGILGGWDINSTQFYEICSEPAFQAAYNERGVQEFFTGYSGSTVDPAVDTDYFGFVWDGPCQNSSWAGQECSEQEYWAVNLTSGRVSGPIFQEGRGVCSCPAVIAVATPAGLILLVALVATVAIVAIFVRRRRVRRIPPGTSRAVDSSPPGGPPG